MRPSASGPPAPSLNKSLHKCPWPRWPAAVLARCRAVAAPVAASRRREPGRGPAALGRGVTVSGVPGFSRPGCAVECAALLPALFWLRMITKEAFRVDQRVCSVRPGNLSLLYRLTVRRLQGLGRGAAKIHACSIEVASSMTPVFIGSRPFKNTGRGGTGTELRVWRDGYVC
jgi:hypothetical protein